LTEDHIRRITRGEGCISGVTYAPIARERGPSAPSFGGSFLFMRTPLSQNYQISHVERGLFCQPCPIQRGRGPNAPQFWSPFYLSVQLCRRTTKFDVVTHVGEGRVSWDQPHLPSNSQESGALLNLWVSAVFMPTSFNAEQPNSYSNTYGEGRVFRLDALALSVIATATWLAGWLAGWLSVTAGIVSKRLNLSENFWTIW